MSDREYKPGIIMVDANKFKVRKSGGKGLNSRMRPSDRTSVPKIKKAGSVNFGSGAKPERKAQA